MKIKAIQSALHCSTVSMKDATVTVKQSYFWGVTQSGEQFADLVARKISGCQILDFGNHFHGFTGSSRPGSPQDSYFWCKFKLAA